MASETDRKEKRVQASLQQAQVTTEAERKRSQALRRLERTIGEFKEQATDFGRLNPEERAQYADRIRSVAEILSPTVDTSSDKSFNPI